MLAFVVFCSFCFQFLAGLSALRLVGVSGRNWAWLLLSAGIFIMAFRRLYALVEIYQGTEMPPMVYEMGGLVISVLILLGVQQIAPLLRDMQSATERFAQSEERYRTVALFTHDWEYWLSPGGEYLYVSPASERLTGYGADEFIRNPDLIRHIIHPDDQERVREAFAKVNGLREPMHFDCRIVHKDGSNRWVAHNSIPVWSEDGVFLGIRASVRNIDHRKRLEGMLRESQAMYRGLVEDSRTMVLRLDREGMVTFANANAAAQFAQVGQSLLRSPIREVLRQCEGSQDRILSEEVADFLATGNRLEVEVELCRADGSSFWSEWVGSAIRDDQGTISQFVCVGIDVTNRKALDKLKEDVTRIIRHDLKSPLAGVIGIPRVMRKDENLTPRQVELLKAVEDAGTIMMDLINQSLNLYKLETGTYAFDKEDVDVVDLTREALRHVRMSVGKKVEVALFRDGRPLAEDAKIILRAERTLLFTMLCNLLRNALEASDGQPVGVDMKIADMKGGETCRIDIANRGVVPEAIRDTFFDKYVTSGKSGGTGLGTYSARLIARQHGGDVTMRSSRAEGTVVSVTLRG